MGRIEEIRGRLAKVTPGPWEVSAWDAGHSRYEMDVSVIHAETGDQICDLDGLNRSYNEKYDDDGYADAQFIANAPADIAWLLEQLDKAKDAHN